MNSSSTLVITACDSFASPSGNYVWYLSGIYSDTINTALGCDSIITINLNIMNFSLSAIPQSSTSFCLGDSVLLTANSGLSSYQWYNRNYPIVGAMSSNYYAKNKGKYTCVAQNTSGCTDTSNIIEVSVPCVPIGPAQEKIQLSSSGFFPQIHIIPNPNNGVFIVESPPGKLDIFDCIGKLVLSTTITEPKTILEISENTNGIYSVLLHTNGSIYHQKIILSNTY